MTFTTLADEEEKELHRLCEVYWREVLICKKSEAYLAGCIILGSVLEAILILMVDSHPEEAEQTGKVPTVKGKPKPLLDWTLIELLRVAKSAQWLPSALDLEEAWSGRKAQIGDHAEVVRLVRNLVHPARYVKDFSRKKITLKYLQQQFERVLLCCDWLAVKNNNKIVA